MTEPPLPGSPCMRVKLDYTENDGYLAGSRFYLSYAGSAPTGANCTSIATSIQEAWTAHLAAVIESGWALTEVDVLDIATEIGLSGQWTGTESASRSGDTVPFQCATNIEFDIARRYRGGKPRMYLPPATVGDQLDGGHWSTAFIDSVNTAFGAFMTAVEAISVGAVGSLAHVNLSYYKGFTNITNSSGRERAVPTYRDTALVDTIVGYSTKPVISSQKRRRASTTY